MEAAQLLGVVVDLGASMRRMTSFFASLGVHHGPGRVEVDGFSGASGDGHHGLEVSPVSFRGLVNLLFAGCGLPTPEHRPEAGCPEALVLPGEGERRGGG